MRPIGKIHTPFIEKAATPIQYSRSTVEGEVELFPEFETGLDGIDGFSHLILLYVFDRSTRCKELMVKPLLDTEEHGVFATRYFCRPNAIGYSVVEFIERTGTRIKVRNVDMLDDTPLLDIKPYVPEFDTVTASSTGWYSHRSIK
jgi:tRNA-Thr(GGU) m(6)t(6)A37 methyltransferase TsaA